VVDSFFSRQPLRTFAAGWRRKLSVNRVANVAYHVNERRIAYSFSQAGNENFQHLAIIIMCMFPNAFAQFRARENTARLTHQHFQQSELVLPFPVPQLSNSGGFNLWKPITL
jgi:hypothetical protein